LVNRPVEMNAYEFVVLAALRAQQLLAGCVPRVEGDHSAATMAQMEVAGGFVSRAELGGSSDPAAAKTAV
jgi:DNA-directed RNA polymerase subunit K/omega